MLKILTNDSIRDISYICLRVLSTSLPPYLLMIILTLINMSIIKSLYHSFDEVNLLDTILVYL